MSRQQEGESGQSNDDDYTASDDNSSLPLPPSGYQMHNSVKSMSIPETSSGNSTSTGNSVVYSGDVSGESGSESEYDPQGMTERRTSRSSGRPVHPNAKIFACPECGKRFDRGSVLQSHRRSSHGKGNGPPILNQQKFSNTSHRCDWVDPVTGKSCNTVFSRP